MSASARFGADRGDTAGGASAKSGRFRGRGDASSSALSALTGATGSSSSSAAAGDAGASDDASARYARIVPVERISGFALLMPDARSESGGQCADEAEMLKGLLGVALHLPGAPAQRPERPDLGFGASERVLGR